MMRVRLMAGVAWAAMCACGAAVVGAAPEEYELVPADAKTPYVFAAKPGEFKGQPNARSFGFKVDGAGRFAAVAPLGRNGALKIRIRATDEQTEAVEVTFKQRDGKVWGTSSLPISTEWHDVLLPYAAMNYFSHWGNLPPVAEGELPDEDRLTGISFCYGAWLCRGTLDQPHGFEVQSVKLVRLPEGACGDGKDHSLDEFPRFAGETDDAPRFQRAINATPGGVLTVPRGVYSLAAPLRAQNLCSFDLNKNAILRATKPMKCVLELDGRLTRTDRVHDYNVFFRGGVVDGNGLASCVRVRGFAHCTMKGCTLLNGKEYGLRVDDGYEMVANNVYAKCTKPGLAGNSAFYVNGGDSHYTDCIVVDYTIGFNLKRGGSNRLTRCHVWGGPIPPPAPGELPEMLKGSINFNIECSSAILRDCYADTGEIGFLVNGWDTRLLGCSYFNNKDFKLDHITIVKHLKGNLLVEAGHFVKTTPHYRVYDGCGPVEWRNMIYSGFGPKDECPGALAFGKASPKNQPAVNLAE